MSSLHLRFYTLCLLLCASTEPAWSDDYKFHHENVLGTSLELQVRAPDKRVATRAEKVLLEEIDRLNSIFSSYDPQSEFAQLQKADNQSPITVSPELFDAFAACEEWKRVSKGAFNPATELLSNLWRQAGKQDRLPSSVKVSLAAQQVNQKHWRLDAKTTSILRESDVPLTLDAIAKGVILDRAAEFVYENVDEIQGLLLNIGGDMRIAGDFTVNVGIADPHSDDLGSPPITHIPVSRGGIATSGSSERKFSIQDRVFSHVIDPRSGIPVKHIVSATVIAESAETADALATICNVLPVHESLALVNLIPHADCFLVTANGLVTTSTNWPQKEGPQKSTSEEQTGHDMRVEFEINKPAQSRRYRRPYVAVWIEDTDKFPVKTLSLFLMQNNPGPRWYRDLRRWYADEQIRKLADPTDMIATISKPTRNPGKYKVSWDGRDDSGTLVEPGKYTLFIEAAREHGTYQLMKHEFELGKAFEAKLKGNPEISSASVSYKTTQP